MSLLFFSTAKYGSKHKKIQVLRLVSYLLTGRNRTKDVPGTTSRVSDPDAHGSALI
jgi:hypothetical protein